MRSSFFNLFICFALLYITTLPIAYAQQRIELRLVPDVIGFDCGIGQFAEGYKYKEYHMFDKRKLSAPLFAWGIGLELELLDKWKTRFRFGSRNYAYGYTFGDPYDAVSGSRTEGRGTVGGELTSFSIQHKIDVWQHQFKYNKISNIGLKLYAGAGVGYEYIPKYNRTDTFRFSGGLGYNSLYSKTENSSTGSLSAGIDLQLRYKHRPVFELGLWYRYALRNTELFKLKIEHGLYPIVDEVLIYPGRHSWIVYLHIPMIKLYSNFKR